MPNKEQKKCEYAERVRCNKENCDGIDFFHEEHCAKCGAGLISKKWVIEHGYGNRQEFFVPTESTNCKECQYETGHSFNCSKFVKTSPTKPDHVGDTTKMVPEEWELNLGKIVLKAWKDKLWHSEATFTTDIKDFIRLEKEKSYNSGLGDKLVANWKEVEEKGRHSVYNEILELVEKHRRTNTYKDNEAAVFRTTIGEIIELLKEKLTQK